MKQEILNNLGVFLDYTKQGVEFVKEQAPLYVQELIHYGTIKYTFYTVFCFAGMVLSLIAFIVGIVMLHKGEDNPGMIILTLGGSISALAFIMAFFENINLYWQVNYAPRVFVMDYLLKLVG